MEPFALMVLEWIGKAIAQKVLGKALTTAWQRLSPKLELLVISAEDAERKAIEQTATAAQIADDSNSLTELLIAANEKIQRLQAENAALRERLTAAETPKQPTMSLLA
jgi:uncharacterized protein YhdP